MQLVLDTHEISLKVRNRCFHVSAGDETRNISPTRLSSIAVLCRCTISSAAIHLAVEHQIPIVFFSDAGDPSAQVWSPRFGNLAELRRAQVLFALSDAAVGFALDLFRLKTNAQVELLESLGSPAENIKQMKELVLKFDAADFPPDSPDVFARLMGIEGGIARLYWSTLSEAAPEGYRFSGRSRRPAADMFNAALNYCYGMLYNTIAGAAIAAGLDPMLGIIHADQHGAPTLAFDLIEPFRPAADRLTMRLFQEHSLEARHFDLRPGLEGVWLERDGRKIIIPAFNDFLLEEFRFNGTNAPLKNHIYRFAGDFAAQLKTFWENDPAVQLRHRRRPLATPDGE